jgi:NAD(P) transhydrogenase subunit beta
MTLAVAALDPSSEFVTACYIVAFSLFIFGVRQGTHPTTARRGNLMAAGGMGVAVAITLWLDVIGNGVLIVLGILIGTLVGGVASRRVQMTQMPQMVALYNGVGGGAAALIAWAEFRHRVELGEEIPLDVLVPILFSLVVGSVSFWGSNIAFAKLQELISGRPIRFGGQHIFNGLLLAGILAGCIALAASHDSDPSQALFIAVLLAAALLGNLFVLPIGGADMPVVISMLNSYSGWAAAGIGFTLGNSALIITGALVGSSGAILSYIMCKGMNRSFVSVILGGFGGETAGPAAGAEQRPVKQGSAEDAAFIMKNASKVIVVPGYGMAVAQAQHALREMADQLKQEGVEIKYAIHPVAGRMPGHMNVLLAEANVPYDEVFELEDINSEFAQADVAFVIGANDVTNPAAKEDPQSPIYGMPVLEVWKANTVMFIKRSLSSGYAGIDNTLFYRDNTMMLFGDAKKMTEEVVKAL